MTQFTFRLLAAVAAVALSVGAASAAPISSTDGVSGDAGLTTNATSFFLNWAAPGQGATDTATTKFNGALTGVGAIPTFLANYEFSKTANAVAGGTQYNFTNFASAFAVQLQPTAGQGGGTVDFGLSSLSAFVPNASTNTMIIMGNLTLLQNTSAFDFSPYNNGGSYTITFNTGGTTNLNSVIANGGSATGSASFSTAAVNATPTPEPASLALFGVLAVGGLVVARRKLATRPATTV